MALAIFFPIFFGLMVGDVGYGAMFIVLGYLGLKKVKSDEWRAIATMLFFGGIASFFFGLFVFGDMFGIAFTTSPVTSVTWSAILGINVPQSIAITSNLSIPLGFWDKIGNVKILLFLAVWIGIAQLSLGLIIGIYNVGIRHGWKSAFMEKFSWLMLLIGGAMLLLVVVGVLIQGQSFNLTDPLFLVGITLIVVGAILTVVAEGGKAVIEMPEMLSNILSYTRLTAIGLSKAGLALAFNTIAIVLIAPAGGIALVAAVAIFVVGQLMIFILAIISAGLHAIRLQYVEFFSKFYEGGGQDFNPLMVRRKHTKMEE